MAFMIYNGLQAFAVIVRLILNGTEDTPYVVYVIYSSNLISLILKKKMWYFYYYYFFLVYLIYLFITLPRIFQKIIQD